MTSFTFFDRLSQQDERRLQEQILYENFRFCYFLVWKNWPIFITNILFTPVGPVVKMGDHNGVKPGPHLP